MLAPAAQPAVRHCSRPQLLQHSCVVEQREGRERRAVTVLSLTHAAPRRAVGVSRDADEATIKKSYRKLAVKYHPARRWRVLPSCSRARGAASCLTPFPCQDKNPGDTEASNKFADINNGAPRPARGGARAPRLTAANSVRGALRRGEAAHLRPPRARRALARARVRRARSRRTGLGRRRRPCFLWPSFLGFLSFVLCAGRKV